MDMANKSSNKKSPKRPRPVTRKAGTVGRGYGNCGIAINWEDML